MHLRNLTCGIYKYYTSLNCDLDKYYFINGFVGNRSNKMSITQKSEITIYTRIHNINMKLRGKYE